ncbi:MAG: AIR synthase-related protein, partial [Devosia sp.]
TIGGVGLIPDWSKMARAGFAAEGEAILLIGAPPSWGTHLGQSIYLRDLHQRRDGPPPPVDLAHERRVGDFVRGLIRSRAATAVHDLSDGGLGVALAEMAMASGIGATVSQPTDADPIPVFFGEDQGRYLVTIAPGNLQAVQQEAATLAIPAPVLGETGGSSLKLGDARPIPTAELKSAHEGWFPRYMAGEL